jgi:hypothetical protein
MPASGDQAPHCVEVGLDGADEARPRLRHFLGYGAGLPDYKRAVWVEPQSDAIAPTGGDDAVSGGSGVRQRVGAAHVFGVARSSRIEVVSTLRMAVGFAPLSIQTGDAVDFDPLMTGSNHLLVGFVVGFVVGLWRVFGKPDQCMR